MNIIILKGEEHIVELPNIRVVVVDEIDRMLKEGHFHELRHIIKHIHRFIKRNM
jgi:superfamily II DNA/RNA helicase